MIEYRIFMSYRGKSDTKYFIEKLYNYMINFTYSKEKYGNIYYSPVCQRGGESFDLGIPDFITEATEYFVMPLSDDYFDDFLLPNGETNDRSITYKEIKRALSFKKIKFMCLRFSKDYKINENLIRKLFPDGDDARRIITSFKIDCFSREGDEGDEAAVISERIAQVANDLAIKLTGASERLKTEKANAFITFKKVTEKSPNYPFFDMMHDVKKITLMNLASTSFIKANAIADGYEENIMNWFSSQIKTGAIAADIILLHPYSEAAKDAVMFKMYPADQKKKSEDIIPEVLRVLYKTIREYPEARLNLFLTSIALPYGVMNAEHYGNEDRQEAPYSHMKVDLYAPLLVHERDDKRPAFYLCSNNSETKELYDFFLSNVRAVKHDPHTIRFNGTVEIPWLLDEPIIHKGVCEDGMRPHSRGAFERCIEDECPMEVDLVALKDGTIIVGRADEKLPENKYNYESLTECSMREFSRINDSLEYDEQYLTLERFLELVHGTVPLLIEFKTKGLALKENSDELDNSTKDFIADAIRELQKYAEKYGVFTPTTSTKGFAVHSSNPYVLKEIKEIDCLIPCGIISTDFAEKKDIVGEEFFEIHDKCSFRNIIYPDFICYDIECLYNEKAKRLKKELDIPVIAWTIRSKSDKKEVKHYSECDNYIVEGSV